jgi:hypothetical protein
MSDSSLITSEMFNENDQTIVEQSTANLHVHARCTHEPFYWVSTINLNKHKKTPPHQSPAHEKNAYN